MNSAIQSTAGKNYSSRILRDRIPFTKRIKEMHQSFDRDFLPILSQIYEMMLVL